MRRAIAGTVPRGVRPALAAASLLLLATGGAAPARADIAEHTLRRSDGRGSIVHAVPVSNDQVRMAAERVVLVPYLDAGASEPRLLTHVWYDLVNEGPRTRLRLGFPELAALVEGALESSKRPWTVYTAVERTWSLPTIAAFSARQGARHFPVRSYPGVGRYRRWFGFEVDLDARQTTRLHTTYLTSLARTTWGQWTDDMGKRARTTRHLVHYVLHTGARWRGPIGAGEVLLYQGGERHVVRRFTALEPTVKDDVHLELDLRVTDWEGQDEHHQRGRGRVPDLRLHLAHASGALASERVDTHVGLVVDGDPETHWVSPRGAATRSFVQLPSSRARVLVGLDVTSGQPPAGAVRPARVVLHCLRERRTTVLARSDLPDTAGPHRVAVPRGTRCEAIRAEVAAVHGRPEASVAIAELEQRFAAPVRFVARTAPRPPDRRTGVVAGGPRVDALAFDRAGVDGVSWSPDGALLHYRLHLENVRPPFGGVRLGYVVEAATSKVVRTYRVTRSGKLPLPYERDWAQAVSLAEGEALLARQQFQPAVAARLPPAGAGPALRVVGRVGSQAGTLDVQPTAPGFRWTVTPSARPGTTPVDAALELLAGRAGVRERVLARQAWPLDPAFAARHQATWQARRPFFTALVSLFREQWAHDSQHFIDRLPDAVWKHVPELWHRLHYRYDQAYGGELRLYWEPRGRGVAAVWIARQDHSQHRAVEPRRSVPRKAGSAGFYVYADMHLTQCARDVEVMVCPWDRRDDPRHRIAVTVHALALAAPGPAPARPAAPAVAAPLRVDTFHGVPLPAGGVELGPPEMRQTMVRIYYPRHGKHLVRDVTQGLKRDRWTVVNVPSGDEDRMFPPDYTQIRASKSGATVRLTVDGGDSMVFVTRGP